MVFFKFKQKNLTFDESFKCIFWSIKSGTLLKEADFTFFVYKASALLRDIKFILCN